MPTKKPAPIAPLALTPSQQVELMICQAFYSGPSGHALMDKEDGDVMRMLIQRAREFRKLFFEAQS